MTKTKAKTKTNTKTNTDRLEDARKLCQFGTAMWSEENGAFNLIAHLDENDNNDLDTAKTNDQAVKVATPDTGAVASTDSSLGVGLMSGGTSTRSTLPS